MVELEQQVRLARDVEQRRRAPELGPGRPAAQRLETVGDAFVQVPNRLEHRRDLFFENDALKILLVPKVAPLHVQTGRVVRFFDRARHQTLSPNEGVL